MNKDLYVIINGSGEVLRNKDHNTLLFFETPHAAMHYIESKCGCSPYLDIVKWKQGLFNKCL